MRSSRLLAKGPQAAYWSPVGAAVAQLVEQRIRNAWVGGSNPFRGTSKISVGDMGNGASLLSKGRKTFCSRSTEPRSSFAKLTSQMPSSLGCGGGSTKMLILSRQIRPQTMKPHPAARQKPSALVHHPNTLSMASTPLGP